MALTQVDQGLLGAYAQYTGFKNRIINGAMMIDQRNAGASVTPTSSGYTLDRWQAALSQASKYSVQQNAGSVTPPAGYKNYLGVTSLSAYSVGAGDFFALTHYIEGYNVSDLGFGTANASTVTISFWVRSSLTGSFGGSLQNSAQNRCYPFTYTINSANTWEQKTVTIAGDTSGTWLTDTGRGIGVILGLGVGSTYGSGTAGAWVGSQVFVPSGATSVVGTNGATFYITGVQLEKGSTATSFDYRPYGTELALCQRYYLQDQAVVTVGNIHAFCNGYMYTTVQWEGVYTFPVEMRAAPTLTYSSLSTLALRITGGTVSALSAYQANTRSTLLYTANTAGGAAGYSQSLATTAAGVTAYLAFSSEL